jgi:hypothetical protein
MLVIPAKLKIRESRSRLSWTKSETLFPKDQRGLEMWLKQQSACLASTKPSVQMLVPPKIKLN